MAAPDSRTGSSEGTARPHRSVVSPASIAPPRAHYSHGVVANGPAIYVAGQVPVDPRGQLVEGDARIQARQVLRNLQAVLEAAGASLQDVVRTTVYLVERDDRAAVGEVRREFFPSLPPANTLLVVTGLADPRYLVEIDAIAVRAEAP